MRQAEPENSRGTEAILAMLLAAAAFAVYVPALGHSFVDVYDDGLYITVNPWVQQGLTWEGIVRAFSGFEVANYHPVTWVSHMIDVSLCGLHPAGHHATNIILHSINTVLLFVLLAKLTGALWRSALVAALFALHPTHVESVAWVAERKDVLSTLFWLLTTWAYVAWVSRPGAVRYLLMLLLFALGLLSKPMLVTLPCVLLLMDVWPLRRISLDAPARVAATALRLAWEKMPLFVMSAASSVITVLAQRAGGAVATLDQHPLPDRLANAAIAYVAYLGKMVWPTNLAIIYPYERPSMTLAALAVIVLAVFSAGALLVARRRPAVLVGWLWYLGTLVPVIGIVQVGEQPMADRYTYIPFIGAFIALAWLLPSARLHSRAGQTAAAAVTMLILAVLAWLTIAQVGRWRDSETVFRHAVNVTRHNAVAHFNLGSALYRQGRNREAYEEFIRALAIRSDYIDAYVNAAAVSLDMGQLEQAERHARAGLELSPRDPTIYSNLGAILAAQGRFEEAHVTVRESLRLYPDHAAAWSVLGRVQAELGMMPEALVSFEKARALGMPENPAARARLGRLLLERGEPRAAETQLRLALRHGPNLHEANADLARALAAQGRFGEAANIFANLVSGPNEAAVFFDAGHVFAALGRPEDAQQLYSTALRVQPEWPEAKIALARLLASTDDERVRDARQAQRLIGEASAAAAPDDPFLLEASALISAAEGRFDEALRHVDLAIAAARQRGMESTAAMLAVRRAAFAQRAAIRHAEILPSGDWSWLPRSARPPQS